MTLVNRWYRILEPLVAQNQMAFEELRLQLDVSAQTLAKSIEQLNDILDGDATITQQGAFLQLQVYDYARLETILAGSLRKASDFNSASKRVAYLLKRLLQSSSALVIDDLADEIGVSRSTINKDLKAAKALARTYSVMIQGKPNHGIQAVGTELNLRLLYVHEVYKYFEPQGLCGDSLFFLDELYQTYQLPRKIQELLTKSLAITIERMRQGRYLTDPIPYYSNEVDSNAFMEELVYHIELAYQLSLSQYERQFISFPLNIQYIEGLAYQERPLQQSIVRLYSKMIEHIKASLLVTIDQDKLFVALHTHLKLLVNRLIFHVQANDIFHGEIRYKYPLAFDMANVAAQVLAEEFDCAIELSECSYLALYFEMMMQDAEHVTEPTVKKIAVVCTTGRGTANMICRRLSKVLGPDLLISQFSEEQFNPADNDHYFAIFTTVPLKFGQLKSPVVQITNLFDDQWLQNEWRRVHHYHQKNLATITLHFARLSKGKAYTDYLTEMAELLEEKQLVDRQFGQRLLEREALQSTLFGNRIAFPHTINDKETKTVLLLGLLDEPYREHDCLVEFIFLVAIPKRVEAQMEADLLDIYDDIFKIASDDRLQAELRSLKSQAEFIAFTKEKGVF
ncbi:PRD domain-containing protein [Streptococcus equi subsp. zooepidemicus]|uniref:BglG family transcription antiterminator n=1 Tax=Streptococcus equi TaxID=1336 RepID=UPI001E3992C1|nr:PRD domain-containing protein [Streptococcus equi]MCD3400194.1 PRD domain-containing protein [Streptococcus equi subsp. zooepidemicus]